jgi:peptide/nickel transport system permease protein
MVSYITRRLLQLPVLLLLVSLIVFSLMSIAPGDPVPLMLGDYATKESIAALRHDLGLDRPLGVQYLSWLANAAQGDLGWSVQTRQDILWEIRVRIPNTLALAVAAMSLALLVGIPVGIIASVKQNTWVDYLSMTFALGALSIPSFVLAILLIMVFAVFLRWLPISGSPSVLEDPVGAARAMILPSIALGARAAGGLARMVRSCMVEVLAEDYITTAKGKGVRNLHIYLRHALKNAFIPVLTVIGINFAFMLGGSIVIEQIFSIPGIGGLMMRGVLGRDYPVIQGVSLVVAIIFVMVNLATDVLYSYLDPRIRYD